MRALLASVLALTACAAAPRPRVVLVSIDGLTPDAGLHGDAMPNLQALAARGAWADDVRSVFPSMTYPAHASMVTGVAPRVHGVVSNLVPAPTGDPNRAWRWDAASIAAPTVWDVVAAHGGRAALVGWPSTAGAHADVVVPDLWDLRRADHRAILTAASTPGFIARARAAWPDALAAWHPPKDDVAAMAFARVALRDRDPDLLLVHLVEVDHHQHRDGVASATAAAARRQADALLGALLADLAGDARASATTVLVASDHGFAALHTRVRLGPALVAAGLVTLTDDGALQAWRVALLADGGGLALLVPRQPDDHAACAAALTALAPTIAATGGALTVLDRAALDRRGGDPAACAGVLAAPGLYLAADYVGPALDAPALAAGHGYDPAEPTMRAVLVISGPGIGHGRLRGARLVDVAPTVAARLGLPWPVAENVDGGSPLELPPS